MSSRRVVALLIAVAAPLATAQNPPSQQGVFRTEKEVEFSLELPPTKIVQCAATIDVSYTQRDSTVGVEGTIAHTVCGASSGDYKLVVSVRNENRELQTLEFLESWQRQDDQPVKFSGAYPIGENVDLVRVRPVLLRCTCADVPTVE